MTGPFFFAVFGEPGTKRPDHDEIFYSGWQSPSNIAIVKYWGKKEDQLPVNPSLSMTLNLAVTRTSLTAVCDEIRPGLVAVNGDHDHPFIPKMQGLLNRLVSEIPCLGLLSFQAETSNTFPHSTGIASSASGISAFALCLLDIACNIMKVELPPDEWRQAVSIVSRLGSGSACRSVFGGFAVWGTSPLIPGSSDEFAVSVNSRVHPAFTSLHDAILVVSAKQKEMPSTKGHQSMNTHPFLPGRILQANRNLGDVLHALSVNDFEQLCQVAENEALSLHALIMSANPPVILMQPATLEIIRRVREARKSGLPLFFTLDAGANVHILYPAEAAPEVEKFFREELSGFCENGRVIFDSCGAGPVRLTANEAKFPG